MSAREYYETAVKLHREGHLAEAERNYRMAMAEAPTIPAVLCGVGLICLQTGQVDEAIYRFEQTLTIDPANGAALMGLGDGLAACGHQQQAVAIFARLIATEPANAAAHYAFGMSQRQLGALTEARKALAKAAALAPDNPRYHHALAESAPFTDGDPRLSALEKMAENDTRFSGEQRAELHFALFKAYDQLQRPENAFAHLEKGNRAFRAVVPYDEAAVLAFFHALKQTYTRDAMAALGGAGHASDVPVFVTGMPRSGTTLVEQILASHPDVFGAGELLHVQDLILGGFAGRNYPRDLGVLGANGLKRFGGYYTVRLTALAPTAKRIVDKLPANFRHLGLLHLALPNARLIHVSRDPRDTCFSCYANLFQSGLNYTYDLGELGRYHNAVDKLMAHWRAVLPENALLDVRYEDLVDDFEAVAHRMLAFCGLTWNDSVLRFYETKRAVRTKSELQVRCPIYTSSIGRWRAYEKWLTPLLSTLKKAER